MYFVKATITVEAAAEEEEVEVVEEEACATRGKMANVYVIYNSFLNIGQQNVFSPVETPVDSAMVKNRARGITTNVTTVTTGVMTMEGTNLLCVSVLLK